MSKEEKTPVPEQPKKGITSLKSINKKLQSVETMDIKTLHAEAEKGNDQAQWRLANLYARGLDVPQNYARMFKYCEDAAKQGNRAAQRCLGQIYENGIGMESNLKQAHVYYNLSREAQGALVRRSKKLFREDLMKAQDEALRLHERILNQAKDAGEVAATGKGEPKSE